MTHVETIKPHERLSPELGGTGYLPPSEPSTISELESDLRKAQAQMPSLGLSVWKVKRESSRHPRRLTLPNGRYLECKVIGGTGRDWWFVRVSTADGLKALSLGGVIA